MQVPKPDDHKLSVHQTIAAALVPNVERALVCHLRPFLPLIRCGWQLASRELISPGVRPLKPLDGIWLATLSLVAPGELELAGGEPPRWNTASVPALWHADSS